MSRKNLISLHEAIVVALINQPNRIASFEDIAKFIEERNLYPERKGNIPLATQVMLRSTKAKGAYHHLFEPLGPDHIILRDTEYKRPLELSQSLDAILNHDYYFYNPLSVTLRIFDESSEIGREKSFSPEKVICIVTKELPGKYKSKRSGRKKFIYYLETNLKGDDEINIYHINESMKNLKTKLDKLGFYLATVSDNALVNVGYFTKEKGRELICTMPKKYLNKLKTIRFSESNKAKEYQEKFEIVQFYYKYRISLQKKILGYKEEMGL